MIPNATFDFLTDLAANNDRTWFKTNKERYIEDVQEPALEFIMAFEPRLAAVSPHFTADARVVGGSLFRIHRDTRFSKDKTPYKVNTGVQFRHQVGKNAHAPGYYLHIQPRESFMGVGLWRPETTVAYQIRTAIDEDQQGWHRASRSPDFLEHFELGGDSLVRPPRGYNAEHPLIDDLKRKDFIASTRLSDDEVTDPDFLDVFTDLCNVSSSFMAFLCGAVGVPF